MDQHPASATPRPSLAAWWPAAGLAAILLGTIALFWPALSACLAFDDTQTVVFVSKFTRWTEIFEPDPYQFFRPVKHVFFLAVAKLGGEPPLYHALNLAAYLFAAAAVYTLARRLAGHALWALVPTALWAFAASNATVGCWSSCFNISISVAAVGFGLTAYDRWREKPGHWPDAAVFFGCLTIGLLSYESAVTMAPLAVMIDLYRGRRVIDRASLARFAVVAAVIVAWFALRHACGARSSSHSPSFSADITRLQISASSPYFLWTHLAMWLVPWDNLEVIGSYSWNRSIPAVVLPFCWLILAAGIAIALRRWRPANLSLFGCAWFLIAFFPAGNFLPLGNTPYADYYLALPSIGLCLALGDVLRRLATTARDPRTSPNTRTAAWAALAVIVVWRVAATTETRSWIVSWQTPPVILARTAATRPYQFLAKSSLSYSMLQAQQYDTARWYAQAAVDDEPTLGLAHAVLGELALRQGHNTLALGHFRRSRDGRHFSPDSESLANLRIGELLAENPSAADEAWAALHQVLRRRSYEKHADAVLAAARMFRVTKRPAEELDTLRKGLACHPADRRLQTALAEAGKDQPKTGTKP